MLWRHEWRYQGENYFSSIICMTIWTFDTLLGLMTLLFDLWLSKDIWVCTKLRYTCGWNLVMICKFKGFVTYSWYSIRANPRTYPQTHKHTAQRTCWIMAEGCNIPWIKWAIRDFNTLRPRPNDGHFPVDILNAYSWMKLCEFRLKFHWSLFLRVQLTIS